MQVLIVERVLGGRVFMAKSRLYLPPRLPAASLYWPVLIAIEPMLFVFSLGVKIAVRVSPDPERAERLPPEIERSPLVPFQENESPGSSEKLKVMTAVCPLVNVLMSLLIITFGAVLSTIMASAGLLLDWLPARSIALAVSRWLPSESFEVVIVQRPVLVSAMAVPSRVAPSVSKRLTLLPISPMPVSVAVAPLVTLSSLELPESLLSMRSGAVGFLHSVSST